MSGEQRRRVANIGMVFTALGPLTLFASGFSWGPPVIAAAIPLFVASALALTLVWDEMK